MIHSEGEVAEKGTPSTRVLYKSKTKAVGYIVLKVKRKSIKPAPFPPSPGHLLRLILCFITLLLLFASKPSEDPSWGWRSLMARACPLVWHCLDILIDHFLLRQRSPHVHAPESLRSLSAVSFIVCDGNFSRRF